MSRNKKFIFILLVFFLILILSIASLFLIYRRNKPQIIVGQNANQNLNENLNATFNSNINAVQNENINILVETNLSEEQQVLSLARAFAERYGSFSNRNNFENILDLKHYMTSSLQKWADDFVAREKRESTKDTNDAKYYGVTTKVVSLKLVELASDKAKVELSTQRKETREETGTTNVFFQKLELNFEKDDMWKVDKIKWL